jgi:holo-[acyl-carrier protein] synthase
MIFGIGTDIVAYGRILAIYERHGERFAKRILNEAELAGMAASRDPARFLMKRFAAKEAFSKAVGTGFRNAVALRNIRIGHDALGKPVLEFAPALSDYLAQLGIRRHFVSISDEQDSAVAFVVLEKD